VTFRGVSMPAQPKPESRATIKARKKLAYQRARNVCWGEVYLRARGLCEDCGRPVKHKHDPEATEWTCAQVHEVVLRSQGGDSTDPANCKLLCCLCHATEHGRG